MEKLLNVRCEGGKSRVLTLTKYLPADWRAVTISLIKSTNGTIVLKINRVR